MGFCLINTIAVAAADAGGRRASGCSSSTGTSTTATAPRRSSGTIPGVTYVSTHESASRTRLPAIRGPVPDRHRRLGRAGNGVELRAARRARPATWRSPRSTTSSHRRWRRSTRRGCSCRAGSTPTAPTRSRTWRGAPATTPCSRNGCVRFAAGRRPSRAVPRGRLRPRRPRALHRRHPRHPRGRRPRRRRRLRAPDLGRPRPRRPHAHRRRPRPPRLKSERAIAGPLRTGCRPAVVSSHSVRRPWQQRTGLRCPHETLDPSDELFGGGHRLLPCHGYDEPAVRGEIGGPHLVAVERRGPVVRPALALDGDPELRPRESSPVSTAPGNHPDLTGRVRPHLYVAQPDRTPTVGLLPTGRRWPRS